MAGPDVNPIAVNKYISEPCEYTWGGRVDSNRDHLLVCGQYESFRYCLGMHDCSLKRYKINAGKSYSFYLPFVEVSHDV